MTIGFLRRAVQRGGDGGGGTGNLIGKLKMYGEKTADRCVGIVQSVIDWALCSCVDLQMTRRVWIAFVEEVDVSERTYIHTYSYTYTRTNINTFIICTYKLIHYIHIHLYT